jgi:hypothetical protein
MHSLYYQNIVRINRYFLIIFILYYIEKSRNNIVMNIVNLTIFIFFFRRKNHYFCGVEEKLKERILRVT